MFAVESLGGSFGLHWPSGSFQPGGFVLHSPPETNPKQLFLGLISPGMLSVPGPQDGRRPSFPAIPGPSGDSKQASPIIGLSRLLATRDSLLTWLSAA